MSKKPNIALVGLGLMGGSIGRALKKHNLAEKISGVARTQASVKRALELGFIDSAHGDAAEACVDADIIFLNVPLNEIGALVEKIAPRLKPNAILTDVGSAKACVMEDVAPYLGARLHFVPAHPIAGTEEAGPDAGFAELFDDRWCILTPAPETDKQAVETIADLWRAFGSEVSFMDAKTHDLILALTSHIPHVIAYNLVGLAGQWHDDIGSDTPSDINEGVVRYSAGGFRDFTRIAASSPIMWRDIFLRNAPAILEVLARFRGDLDEMEAAIRAGDGDFLTEKLTRARDMRQRIIAAGQDTALPNFGRNKKRD